MSSEQIEQPQVEQITTAPVEIAPVDQTESATPEAEQVVPERVFVGNLPFQVTKEELEALTPELEIVSVELPTRSVFRKAENTKVLQSKGYGFITYKTEEDALKAIEQIGGKTVGEREVYAKAAVPPSLAPKRVRPAKKTKSSPSATTESTDITSAGSASTAASKSSKKKKKTKHSKAAAGDSAEATASVDSTATVDATASDSAATEESEKPKSSAKPRREPKTKEEKQKKLEEGIPSNETVFIGNLDRSVTSDDIKELLAEFEPQWIRVPRRTLARGLYLKLVAKNVQINNKGIAFVKFKDEDTQKKVIEQFNGKEFKGRQLNVTVAIDSADAVAAAAAATTATSASEDEKPSEVKEN